MEYPIEKKLIASSLYSAWLFQIKKATQEYCDNLFKHILPDLKTGEKVEWKHGKWTIKNIDLPDVNEVNEEFRDKFKFWAIIVQHDGGFVSLILRLYDEEYVLGYKIFERDDMGEMPKEFDDFDDIDLNSFISKRTYSTGKEIYRFEKYDIMNKLKEQNWKFPFYVHQDLIHLDDLSYIQYIIQDMDMPLIYPKEK